MKLSASEREAVSMLRMLDERQREKVLGHMKRQALANKITAKVAGLSRIKIASDRSVEKAFGATPSAKQRS